MTKVYKFPQRKDRLGEVSDWFARIERGLTGQEEAMFQDWLAADPENYQLLMNVAVTWDKMNSMSRLADLFPEPVSRRSKAPRFTLAMAASLLVAMVVAIWAVLDTDPTGLNRPAEQDRSVAETIFETSIGEQSTITLPDGSELTLNTNSLIRANYTESRRAIVLERGEVHVKVTHDKLRPFVVYVGDRVVQAIGTEFNLEITNDQDIELIVTEGRVLVGLQQSEPLTAIEYAEGLEPLQPLPKSSRILETGETLMLGNADNEVGQLEPEEINVKLSWRGGDLVFRGESLSEAITEIERYTPVEFVILNEDLKKVRVVGLFKAGDVAGLLTTLKENFNITYERVSEDKVILTDG